MYWYKNKTQEEQTFLSEEDRSPYDIANSLLLKPL